MSRRPDDRELKKAREIAREYAERGYSVLLQPGDESLPPFLRGLNPDVVASSDAENVVIEVKSSGAIGSTQAWSQIAHAVEKNPGWRFDAVFTAPRTSPAREKAIWPLTDQQLRAREEHARNLAREGDFDAAILLSWTLVEAALRVLAESARVSTKHRSHRQLAKILYSSRVISRNLLDSLNRLATSRDLVMRGYSSTSNNRHLYDLSLELAKDLRRSAKKAHVTD